MSVACVSEMVVLFAMRVKSAFVREIGIHLPKVPLSLVCNSIDETVDLNTPRSGQGIVRKPGLSGHMPSSAQRGDGDLSRADRTRRLEQVHICRSANKVKLSIAVYQQLAEKQAAECEIQLSRASYA
jgi:hypothetical protein